jgi:hypothetical protein
MERGHALEDEARQACTPSWRDADPVRVGFMRNGRKGASPDSLIDDDGGLEIKTLSSAISDRALEAQHSALEHVAQVQGSMWVSERDWWEFVSYCPGLPAVDRSG